MKLHAEIFEMKSARNQNDTAMLNPYYIHIYTNIRRPHLMCQTTKESKYIQRPCDNEEYKKTLKKPKKQKNSKTKQKYQKQKTTKQYIFK